MPTTSNFGWTTPADTDLVKDGAAAIRTLGNGVDTSFVDLKGGTTDQVLAKNSNTDLDFKWVAQDDSNAIQNALLTTTGDTIYASAASTPARLGLGTAGQVLTVNSGATAPEWAAPAAAVPAFNLLATQAVTTGNSYSITGLSGYNTLFVLMAGLSSTAGGVNYSMTLNSDTGSNYILGQAGIDSGAAASYGGADTKIPIATQGSNAGNTASASVQISGANGASNKIGVQGGGSNGTNSIVRFGGFSYSGTSVISSVQVITSGTFDAGTIYVYGSVA